jgi:Protein of unknown function (DUF3606)
MPKTKTKRGRAADRRRIARGQAYEVNYFARKHGLTAAEAREIIKQARGSRDKQDLAERGRGDHAR